MPRRLRGRRVLGAATSAGRLGDPRRELGRRPGREQQVVRAPELLELLLAAVVADEIDEVGPAHNSPSSSSARRRRPLRVRVFTVPSGIDRKSAISLCERPLQ